ncbi:MAG: hypothetical protein WA435_01735 [Gallionellaceae bacterium]
MAKTLHDELDKAAGGYLWDFLEKEWKDLSSNTSKEQLERIIRRRAALAISDLMPGSEKYVTVPNRYGLEYYIYPSLEHDYYSLGDIIKNKSDESDIRVILTPHCHLILQDGAQAPKADYVLTVKTVSASSVLGKTKIDNVKAKGVADQDKQLKSWANSPANTERKPAGRHWYLPKFLKIPHLYVDFLQVVSIEYGELNNFERIATLAPPYAEALQTCFSGFYASVGIPVIDPDSIRDLLV